MSQQRHLETLRARKIAGERPVVRVGDVDHEFLSVGWGGASPLVTLADPAGRSATKTAAQWTKDGARLVGRSRDLAGRARRAGPGVPRSSPKRLMAEVEQYLAQPTAAPVAAAPIITSGRVRIRGRSQRTGAVTWLRADGTPTDHESEAGSYAPGHARTTVAEFQAHTTSPVTGKSRWDLELLPDERSPAAIRMSMAREDPR